LTLPKATLATLHIAPSDALSPSVVGEIRTLLDAAFDGDFTAADWEHATGGTHVWVTSEGVGALATSEALVSHGSLVERTLVCSGEKLTVGHVEAVATTASHRRQGHGTLVLHRLGQLIHAGYRLGALSTGTPAFYETHGWERWRGPTFVDSPTGRVRTPHDDDGIMILRTPRSPRLDLDGEIVCDGRTGDVW
jgi:aminoglycoside 2'-N-acetyltransferase I